MTERVPNTQTGGAGENLKDGLILRNDTGVRWAFAREADGYACGAISVNDALVETPLRQGLLFVRDSTTGEERWLCGSTSERAGDAAARFSGEAKIEGVAFTFQVTVSLPGGLKAARIEYRFSVDQDLVGWEVGLAYHAAYAHTWSGHIYPLAEDTKAIAESPLTYVGVPAALLYRDDLSLALLYGFDLQFDYLNPTTWTGDCGFFFTDGVVPPQFRVGGRGLKAGAEYIWPLQMVFSDAGDGVKAIVSLVQQWIVLNRFAVEPLHARSVDEALDLFIAGRRNTTLWNPGIGYKLEEGDLEANFVYVGEQPLSAYFEYLLYEMTGDVLWRERCFEQMDFVLRAQDTDPASVNYGAMHTACDLGKRAFDSDDRGSNVGYKPDLNAYMARYMLMTWQRVREHEGLDRQDWYLAAVRAADWVLRQRNADGGLPQVVRYPFVYMEDEDDDTDTYFHKSISSTSGRALPAMPVIYHITGDERYRKFAQSLEAFVRTDVEGRFRFTGHHPDLPPDELEEASIWGVIEYWLDKYDRMQEGECLARAVADAYLSLLWWCPRQLSWVTNPTQFGAAEQQHFLQYSIYCYQNRKVQCLWRLYGHTGDPLFRQLYERVLQGIFWTQETEGDVMGATHERIADPWLARDDYGGADFNSLGTIYMGEQSLDCMLQMVEMWRSGSELYVGADLTQKVYPDGVCYYSADVSGRPPANLSATPSAGTVQVIVAERAAGGRVRWTEVAERPATVQHRVWGLGPGSWHEVRDNGVPLGQFQADGEGALAFALTVEPEVAHEFHLTAQVSTLKN
jgi:hypothetical protein